MVCSPMALSDREFMKSAMKFLFTAAMCALPLAVSADWNLVIAPANVQTELAAPGVFEMRVSNTGADPSPAMDLQAGAIAALLPDYEINLLSGSCGPWRDETALIVFPATLNVARIAIPAVAPASGLQCLYSFTARRADSRNFRLAFGPIDRPNAPKGLIQIGALTDLGATATLLTTTQVSGQTINRYRIRVSNLGNFDVRDYALTACLDNGGVALRTNFPGGCAEGELGAACFSSGISITAGPIASAQNASCEVETPAGNLVFARLRLSDVAIRPDGRAMIDVDSSNNQPRLILGEPTIQVPTLSWLGLMSLIFGIALAAQNRDLF